MSGRNKNKNSAFQEIAWLEWRKGGKIQVYELARDQKRIRIRTGVKGKKFSESVVAKDSVESARIFFEKQKRDKLRTGKYVLIEKDDPNKNGVRLPSLESTHSPPPNNEKFQFSFNRQQSQKEKNPVAPEVFELPSELDFEVELSDDAEEDEYSEEDEDDADEGDDEDEEDEDEEDEESDNEATVSPVRSLTSDAVRRSLSRGGSPDKRHGSDAGSHASLNAKGTAASSSTSSSSSSGRPSDTEYEMDYEHMADLMRRAISKFEKDLTKGKAKIQWKRLKRWIRYDVNGQEHEERNAKYHVVPLLNRIAGSCHELIVVRIRSGETEDIVTRLLKVARDPDEDNAHHFITERRVASRLAKIARVLNRCYHSRTDICIWPVETICFEWNGQSSKWATVQAPFLPPKQSNYCFVKIEPNSGAPCVNDAVVGRYQHAYAAVSRGMDLVRDWQGYGVDAVTFGEECKKYCPEALDQLRPRSKGPDPSTQVLVVIDPVLTTSTAHYETNNPTDFGVKAIDEWLGTHDCERSRCAYFHLKEDICFGLADPDQEFLMENAPDYLRRAFAGLRRDLNVWCGDDSFDPASYF